MNANDRTPLAIIGSVAALAVAGGAALAQTSAPQTGVPVDSVYTILMPVLLAAGSAAATVVTALSVYALAWVRKKLNLTDAEAAKLGLDMDAHHRDALQTALTNAAGVALNRLGNDLKGKVVDVRNPAVLAAVDSVLKSAPDAIAYFGLDRVPGEIAEKIVGKIPQIANTASPS